MDGVHGQRVDDSNRGEVQGGEGCTGKQQRGGDSRIHDTDGVGHHHVRRRGCEREQGGQWRSNRSELDDGERGTLRVVCGECGVPAGEKRVRVDGVGGGIEREVQVSERGGREQDRAGEHGGRGWVCIGGGVVRGGRSEHCRRCEWAGGSRGGTRGERQGGGGAGKRAGACGEDGEGKGGGLVVRGVDLGIGERGGVPRGGGDGGVGAGGADGRCGRHGEREQGVVLRLGSDLGGGRSEEWAGGGHGGGGWDGDGVGGSGDEWDGVRGHERAGEDGGIGGGSEPVAIGQHGGVSVVDGGRAYARDDGDGVGGDGEHIGGVQLQRGGGRGGGGGGV